MTFGDLAFMVSFLLATVLTVRIMFLAILGRWAQLRLTGVTLAALVGCYAAALLAVGLAASARRLDVGEAKCFDEWCASVTNVT